MQSLNSELGVFVQCPHPEMIEAIALAGFDFAVIDMEHAPLGPRDLYSLVLAAECRKLPIVVRIPQVEESYVKWCLDLNIRRIQIPQVETVDDVLLAIRHGFFSPKGERGLCRFVRAADFSAKPKDQYLESSRSVELIFQIEGESALKNLDAILDALPAGASIFIGPYDLSQSLGKPGDIWDAEVLDAMDVVIKKCKSKNIGVGTFTDTIDGIRHWRARGLDFIEYASDLNLFLNATKALFDACATPKDRG